ncbi:hypothetical protein [Persephonella sp.]
MVIFYEKDLVIKAEVEAQLTYGTISGGYVEIKKDFYKIDTYKTFYSPPFLFSSKNSIEIFKEIDTKYIKVSSERLWNFSKKINVGYQFAELVYFISGILVHMILFVKYKRNYKILSLVFKDPIKLKAKYGNKDLETPLYLHGISFLVTNKKDFKNIEKIIKSHGGKIKWKLTTIKP